ncbi:MAG TPA: hypothetical protein VEZ16_00090 [Microvirga sp.]|nr:hypothetical protein [Microvirga sp.]
MTIPNIPDAPRFVDYDAANSAGPFPVPFTLYDSSPEALWVTLDGVRVTNFSLAVSPVPGFYGAPNTWTGGTITFAAPISGKLRIRGWRAPRRVANYQEGRGIPARDQNTEWNILTAGLREIWDFSKDALEAVGEIDEARGQTLGARDETIGARNATLAARDQVLPARDQTIGARDLTLNYLNQTQTARGETFGARDVAVQASSNAEFYADLFAAYLYDFNMPGGDQLDWNDA